MPTNDELFQKAKKAIQDLFSDDSVPPEQTKEKLEELAADIDAYVTTLDA